jgi:hypothetical protein
MLGAMACGIGCADFFVSLLSHATSKINPAATAIIFKRFKQHSMSGQACPQSYISVGRIQQPNGSAAPRITWNKRRTQLSHERPKKTHKTGTTTGYVGQSTKTTPRPAVTPYDESVPAETRTILFDSQTAGGLLLSVARADAAALLDALKECGRARS